MEQGFIRKGKRKHIAIVGEWTLNTKPAWGCVIRRFLSYVQIVPVVALLILGIQLLRDPYLYVPLHTSEGIWSFVALDQKKMGIALWIRSKGTFTANYPIDVEAMILAEGERKNMFTGRETVLLIPDAYPCPKPEKQIEPARISLGLEGHGEGTIIFPYPGTYYHFLVCVATNVNGTYFLCESVQEGPVFVIENYGLRLQIENANRTIGVGIISLSIAVAGLGLKQTSHSRPLRRTSHKGLKLTQETKT